MKRALFIIVCLATAILGRAQEQSDSASSPLDSYMETGMEVEGVRMPHYDEEGNLAAQLYGGHVKMLEGGMAEITDLRIDVYQDEIVVMTVFAPKCFTQQIDRDGAQSEKMLSVYSEGDVLIEMDSVTVSGRGFRFNSADRHFEIMNDSRVLVDESVRNMKGVEL